MLNKFVYLLLAITLITSCSKTKQTYNVKEKFFAYMHDQKDISVYGRIQLDEIFKMDDFNNLGVFTEIYKKEYQSIQEAIDVRKPIYMAVKLDQYNNPETFAIYFSCNDIDSLSTQFSSKGLYVESLKDGMKVIQESKVMIGFKDNMGVVFASSITGDSKVFMKRLFELEGRDKFGDMDEKLDSKNQIVVINNMTEPKELAYSTISTLDFKNGETVFESEVFSKMGSNHKLLKSSSNPASVLNKLGTGKAYAGLSFNLDLKKVEKYIDAIKPQWRDELAFSLYDENALDILSTPGSVLEKILTGKAAMVSKSPIDYTNGAFRDYNANIELGKYGREIVGSIFGRMFMNYTITDSNLLAYNNDVQLKGSTKLEIPPFAKEFGKNGIDGFLDFAIFNQVLALDPAIKTNLKAFEHVILKANNDKLTLKLIQKNKSKNIFQLLAEINKGILEDMINN